MSQNLLSSEQVEAFRNDQFVEDQLRHFIALLGPAANEHSEVVDVGGGCGFFARRLQSLTGRKVRVIDTDETSIEVCRRAGVEAVCGDALRPEPTGREAVATFNLMLHHLVGRTECETREFQLSALSAWRAHVQAVFVSEYIYESYLADFSGWLIFHITKSRVLSAIARLAGRVAPSLKANTLGIGVRFRSRREWLRLFAAAGYEVRSSAIGFEDAVSVPRRMLLIRGTRRDSFLLQPSNGQRA
ncbi:MAG: class I SAM-dependent methyltransferase [Gammaproteobacteria bacterium]|nr:class I SAM-dependent methyltransferase [Gammaproteobacteria bacterium]